MLTNYIKIAFRNLQRNTVFSFINIFGLASGLTCTILIVLWIQDEVQHDKIHSDQTQLYRVLANTYWGDVATSNTVPSSLNEAFKKQIPEIQYAATLSDHDALLSVDNVAFKEKGYYASPDFLKMFSFPLLKGNSETALTLPTNIVITHSLAKKYFGKKDPIGETIKVDNGDVFQVTGVLRDIPSNSSLKFDWLIPFETFEKNNTWVKRWGSFSTYMYVKLVPEASLENLNNKLRHFLRTATASETKDEIFLQPFSDMYLFGDFKSGKQNGGRIQYVRLFSVIACFVLVIACINFMNLTTARYTRRIKEVGIRKVNGAGRKALITQFLGEAVLLTFIAVLIGLVMAEVLLPSFNTLTSKRLEIDYRNPLFMSALISVTLLTGLVSGSYPALFLSSFKPVNILKSSALRVSGANTLRKSLVVFQFSLAILLIIGTIIVYEQIQFIKNKNIGFDKENLIIMNLNGDVYKHLDSFQERLKQSEGIMSVASTGDIPIEIDGSSGDLSWPEKAPDQGVSISATWVGYDYIKTIGVPLLAGRDFSKTMADSTSYIVNESAVRLMNLKDPVGAKVSFWNGDGQIIGVVKDFHLHSLHEPITPLILTLQPLNSSLLLIRTESGKTHEAIASLKKVYEQFNSAFPLEYSFMDETYTKRYNSEMIIGKLVNVFAVIAILISCLGLFGLATFTAEQRTKEIGIRKVLGASLIGIISLLSKDYLKLVIIAFLIICPIAYYIIDGWLQQFAYRIYISWWVFMLTGIVSVIIALLTISIQTVKAASANPMESLRSE